MKEFLKYWAADPKSQQDIDGKILYSQYTIKLADLENSRRKTQAFLIPLNTGKGWHPGFDPDMTDAVTRLAAEIDQKKMALKSISEAINDFAAAVGGPSLQPVVDQYRAAKMRLDDLRIKARNTTVLETNRNPRLSPTEIQDLPAVLAVNAALADGREQLDPLMADLATRQKRGREILEKVGGA